MVSAWPEPPNVKSAGARCGVQGTFAVGGFIETPTELAQRLGGVAFGSPLPYLELCRSDQLRPNSGLSCGSSGNPHLWKNYRVPKVAHARRLVGRDQRTSDRVCNVIVSAGCVVDAISSTSCCSPL